MKKVGDFVPLADFRKLAHQFIRVMEGDTFEDEIADTYKLLHTYGITDEDGFEIYEEDES